MKRFPPDTHWTADIYPTIKNPPIYWADFLLSLFIILAERGSALENSRQTASDRYSIYFSGKNHSPRKHLFCFHPEFRMTARTSTQVLSRKLFQPYGCFAGRTGTVYVCFTILPLVFLQQKPLPNSSCYFQIGVVFCCSFRDIS